MNRLFNFCPNCGKDALTPDQSKLVCCSRCGFHFYRNPTVAIAGIIPNHQSQILLIRRAKNPAIGKFAFPGGFVDIGESVDSALRREIHEEVGLSIVSYSFLTSHPNLYHYRDITYPVLDLFFVCKIHSNETTAQSDEVESIQWHRPDEVDADSLAFESMKHAWICYRSQ